jgi:hypothetical protein
MIYCSTEYQITTDEVPEIHSFIDRLSEKSSCIWSASFIDGLEDKIKVVLFACSK